MGSKSQKTQDLLEVGGDLMPCLVLRCSSCLLMALPGHAFWDFPSKLPAAAWSRLWPDSDWQASAYFSRSHFSTGSSPLLCFCAWQISTLLVRVHLSQPTLPQIIGRSYRNLHPRGWSPASNRNPPGTCFSSIAQRICCMWTPVWNASCPQGHEEPNHFHC